MPHTSVTNERARVLIVQLHSPEHAVERPPNIRRALAALPASIIGWVSMIDRDLEKEDDRMPTQRAQERQTPPR